MWFDYMHLFRKLQIFFDKLDLFFKAILIEKSVCVRNIAWFVYTPRRYDMLNYLSSFKNLCYRRIWCERRCMNVNKAVKKNVF